MVKRSLFAFLFLASIVGCGGYAQGPAFTPATLTSNSQGILYIAHADSMLMVVPKIKINGKTITKLPRLGYVYQQLPPGIYRVEFDLGAFTWGPFISEAVVEAGKPVCIMFQGTNMGGRVMTFEGDNVTPALRGFQYEHKSEIQRYAID